MMAKTRDSKERVVATLTEELGASGSVVLADFTGINVEDITELRSIFRDAGIGFTIVKNTLLRRIFNNMDVNEENEIYVMMEGPTALAYAGDEVLPIKILKKFADGHKGLPVVKGGFVSGQTYQLPQMMVLADIPGRDELLAKILGSAVSPMQGIVSVTSGLIRKLFYVIKAIGESKES